MYEASLLRGYIVFNIFLMIYSIFIFFRVTQDLTQKKEYLFFRIFVIAFQFYIVMNSLWTLQEFSVIHLPHVLYVIVCFLSYTSVVFNALCFYAVTMIRFGFRFGKQLWASILGFVPFVAAVTLLFVSLGTGIIFTVEDDHVVTGPAYLALAGCAFIYFLVIVRVSIMKAIKLRTYYARKDAISICLSVVFLMMWVILDGYFDKITIIPVAIFSVILFLFVSMLQSNVYTDALTQLNNRRKTEEYLTGEIENLPEGSTMYIFIADINSFKSINDNYGHAEGDNVLKLFSTALKKVVTNHSGFSARFGGDEFVWSWKPKKNEKNDPLDLLDEIQQEIAEECKQADKPYEISFSVGYAECNDPYKSFGAYLKEADEMMYSNKRSYHTTHD